MDTITIPSPSAFLKSPILNSPTVRRKSSKTATKAKKAQKAADKPSPTTTDKSEATSKPKQSKSRNGKRCYTRATFRDANDG